MHQLAQGIASLGRGEDKMLVHMTPGEVSGLQSLAQRHGGSLTINPHTGLPEAGFLSSILPMIGAGIGIAFAPATGGASLYALGGGALGGMLGSSMEGKSPLMGAIMGGISGYGMGGLGEAFAGMGAETLTGAGALPWEGAGAGSNSVASANSLATASGNPLIQQGIPGMPQTPSPGDLLESQVAPQQIQPPSADMWGPSNQAMSGIPAAPPPAIAPPPSTPTDALPNPVEAAQGKFGMSKPEGPLTTTDTGMMGGFRQATSSPGAAGDFLKKNYQSVAMAGAPLLSMGLSALGGKTALPGKTPAQYYHTSYNPPRYNAQTGRYDSASYGPGSYSTAYAAEGGAVGYATGDLVAKPYRGGPPDYYPLTGDARGPGKAPENSSDIYSNDPGAGINDNKAGRGVAGDATGKGVYENTPSGIKGLFAKKSADTLSQYLNSNDATEQAEALAETRRRSNAPKGYRTVNAAQGGLMGLNTYAAGGKLLRGDGDGMSDSIPAVIQGANPQRAALADGEFVIPADVVSHLGNGSTEAGSKRLYSMMDKVRRARTGNPKQGKQINPNRFLPA